MGSALGISSDDFGASALAEPFQLIEGFVERQAVGIHTTGVETYEIGCFPFGQNGV